MEQQTKDLNSRSELGMDVQDSHKTKMSTGIARIGAVTNKRDITFLCINVCAVISAITSDTAPEPILHTIMTAIYKITLTRDWDEWLVACGGQMPHLHLHISPPHVHLHSLTCYTSTTSERYVISLISSAARSSDLSH
jgi:hypothetical protein